MLSRLGLLYRSMKRSFNQWMNDNMNESFHCLHLNVFASLLLFRCIRCPPKWQAGLEVAVVIVAFAVILIALWRGDANRTASGRTWADIILSWFKIIIGFYQVLSCSISFSFTWTTKFTWQKLQGIELGISRTEGRIQICNCGIVCACALFCSLHQILHVLGRIFGFENCRTAWKNVKLGS